jgi:hypothetical protein
MHVYETNQIDQMPVYVVARGAQEAVDLFITWSAAVGRLNPLFDLNQLLAENLKPEQQERVRGAITAGLVGICHFDEGIGWTFSPPLWVPLGADEQPVGYEGTSP